MGAWMQHQLQAVFKTEAGEHTYVRTIIDLIQGEQLAEADAQIAADLADLPASIVPLCQATTAASVAIVGWDEINAAIEGFEGDAITAIGVDMANEEGIAVTQQEAFEPALGVSFYTDESFPFSASARDAIVAENSSEVNSWQGMGEDIEAYIEIEGLAALNAALLNHKHRIFLRPTAAELEEAPQGPAPVEYIGFVLATLVRVLRFHQAVRAQLDQHGLPGSIPVVLGTYNIRPYVGSALYPARVVKAAARDMAELSIKPRALEGTKTDALTGSGIRRQVAEAEATEVVEKPRGFFARLFGRR